MAQTGVPIRCYTNIPLGAPVSPTPERVAPPPGTKAPVRAPSRRPRPHPSSSRMPNSSLMGQASMTGTESEAEAQSSLLNVADVPQPDSCTAAKVPHSITSSASNCIELGTSMPSALAVCRLITNSNLLDCTTGKSVGFSPLRIRPT